MVAITGARPVWSRWLAVASGVAATVSGHVLSVLTPRVRRRWLPAVPGLASGVLASVGGGEVIGHVFGRGLSPWCAIVIGAVYLARLGSELNRTMPAPPGQE